MDIKEKIVDLDLPAEKRWLFLEAYKTEVNELLACYLKDFEEATFLFSALGDYKQAVLRPEYLEEIRSIASFSRFSEDEVLMANLYYDILKFYFGCTAFAVRSESTTLHGRNLDWHTDNDLLSKHSMIFDFQKDGKTLFKTVGWPGFIGALSGVRPAAFSLTLNAVLSKDKPEIAFPISFLLRDVLATARSYDEAKQILEQTPIASDCLLLLSGLGAMEQVVIERTPRRFASRVSSEGFVVVTNDYKKLENGEADNMLQATSCGRYDRAQSLLRERAPKTAEACLYILQDEDVMMGITVQQMVFDNRTGAITLVKS